MSNSQLRDGAAPVGRSVAVVRPPDEDASELERVARHEAGHVVVCYVLYGRQVVKQVDLHADAAGGALRSHTLTYSRLPIPLSCRPSSGMPRRGNPAPVSAEAIVDAHGVLCYAGLAAEILHAGRSAAADPGSFELSARQHERIRSDRLALASLARTIGVARPADEFFRAYWDEALRLLGASWAGVDLIASALVAQRTLHGDRVDRLLAGAH